MTGGTILLKSKKAPKNRLPLKFPRANAYPAGTPKNNVVVVARKVIITELMREPIYSSLLSALKLSRVNGLKIRGGTDAASTGRLNAVRSIQANGIATNINPIIKSVALKISMNRRLFFMLSTYILFRRKAKENSN